MKKILLVNLLFVLTAVCYSQINSVTINSPQTSLEHFIFNPQTDTVSGRWNYIAPLQKPLFGVASYYWNQSKKVFLCGGADSMGAPVPLCYYYNITSNSYEPRDTLPVARYLGKLVRVKDSLYLVGSIGSNFNVPDGALYKYDPAVNRWTIKTPITSPIVLEMAVCVWKDSLIIAIGGSTNGFGGATNIVRVYNPSTNLWTVLTGTTNVFPVTITTAQAECIGNDIVLVGGSSSVIYNKVYRGYIYHGHLDSLFWLEYSAYTPFGSGVYRLGSAQFGSYAVFGPGLGNTNCINQIWGFNIGDSTWTRFMPNSSDIAANRSLAIKTTSDSLYLYTFGGITRDSLIHFISSSEQYSTGNPLIGIANNGNTVPEDFVLYQNYPNPFNPSTKIKFSIPSASQRHAFDLQVKLIVYDILGKEITTLIDEQLNPGTYEAEWDATKYSSGIYFYALQAGDFFEVKKMVLIK
jgi:Secretion system C-terminal sorting domain/Kelch motif